MPVMDGFTATRLIRDELHLTTPVLAMTAGVTEFERDKCIASGMDDLIAKPIDVEHMLLTINRHLPNHSRLNRTAHANLALANSATEEWTADVFNAEKLFLMVANNPELTQKMMALIGSLIENSNKAMEAVRAAKNTEQFSDMTAPLHSMRGSLGTLGATRFTAAALALESAVSAGELEHINALFNTTEQELMATLAAARSWLESQ